MMRLTTAAALAMILAACGQPPADAPNSPQNEPVPDIGSDMPMPTEHPFCVFVAEGYEGAMLGDAARYVFVTEVGTGTYHGYIQLDNRVTRLVELDAGFGGGIETRHYATENEDRHFEVILLEQTADAEAYPQFTGSVRQTVPVEGEAVKFRGECGLGEHHNSEKPNE